MSKSSSKMARAQNPNRLLGLGACPSINTLQQCLGTNFTSIPVIEYVTWTSVLPVADQFVESTYGNEVNLFGANSSVPGVAAVDSSFVVNGILQTDMFVCGFGAHFFAEPNTWTQIGNSISPVGGVIPPSPDVYTLNDINNGALGAQFAEGGGGTINPAVVEWGAPAWRAAWQATNAYRFIWTVNQRVNVIDEMLADVSYFGPYAEAYAASDSEITIHPYVQRVNAVYAALCKACNQVGGFGFYPVSHRRVGSVSSYNDLGQEAAPTVGNVGIFHPTRDFDLAGTTWGGIANNQAGCCSPFRKLPRPCLIERGLPIGFLLEASNQVNLNNFQSEISASGAPLNGNGSIPEFDAPTGGSGGFSDGTVTPSGGGDVGQQVMAELTLDATPSLASQQVQVGRSVYKGGQFKLSFLIKGYEVMRDWCGFLNGCDAAGNLYMTSGGLYTGNNAAMIAGGSLVGQGR